MAFDYTNLYPDTSANGAFTKSWNYTTLDPLSTVGAVGYFNIVATRIGIGDNIIVAVVDAFDKTRTTLVDSTTFFVTAIAGGVVTVINSKTANLASPNFTGVPTAPTAAVGTSTTQIATTAYVTNAIRERLVGDRTYYVRTDGNDNNTGLVNSAGGAFASIGRAISIVGQTLDINGRNVTIQLADGTYNESPNLIGYTGRIALGHLAPSAVVIQGNHATPSNVIVTGGFTAVETGYYEWILRDFRINGGSANSVYADMGGWLVIDNLVFGTTSANHIVASFGFVEIVNSYSIVGGAAQHYFCVNRGRLISTGAWTVTLSGTPAFSTFMYADRGAYVDVDAVIFSGAATGKRWQIDSNVAYSGTTTALDSKFPGNAAGNFTNQIFGSGTNDAANAGNVGELLGATLANGSAVALTTAVNKTVTSQIFLAGDWDVWGMACFKGGATTTVAYAQSSVSSTNNTLSGNDGDGSQFTASYFNQTAFNFANQFSQNVGPVRMSFAAATTIYLVANAGFAVSTCSAFGSIYGRRRR